MKARRIATQRQALLRSASAYGKPTSVSDYAPAIFCPAATIPTAANTEKTTASIKATKRERVLSLLTVPRFRGHLLGGSRRRMRHFGSS